MKNDHRHTINQVSTYTGLPSYIIRTWEARYSAITPLRSNSNWRLFCDKDIKRLQLLNRAVEIGHSISQVASLSHEDLTGIVRSDLFQSRHHTVEHEEEPLRADTYVEKLLQSITKLDGNGLQAILDEAAVNLTRPTIILDVILPLYMKTKRFVRNGKLRFVRNGKLRVINLSLATSMLQSFLWDMLRTTVVSESAPKVVIVTFTDEQSDIEALALALTIVDSGWKSIYY